MKEKDLESMIILLISHYEATLESEGISYLGGAATSMLESLIETYRNRPK